MHLGTRCGNEEMPSSWTVPGGAGWPLCRRLRFPRHQAPAGPPGAELHCPLPLLGPEQPQTQEPGLRWRRRWRSLACSGCGCIPPMAASTIAGTRPLCESASPISVSLHRDRRSNLLWNSSA